VLSEDRVSESQPIATIEPGRVSVISLKPPSDERDRDDDSGERQVAGQIWKMAGNRLRSWRPELGLQIRRALGRAYS
jgi:hypothetical protein